MGLRAGISGESVVLSWATFLISLIILGTEVFILWRGTDKTNSKTNSKTDSKSRFDKFRPPSRAAAVTAAAHALHLLVAASLAIISMLVMYSDALLRDIISVEIITYWIILLSMFMIMFETFPTQEGAPEPEPASNAAAHESASLLAPRGHLHKLSESVRGMDINVIRIIRTTWNVMIGVLVGMTLIQIVLPAATSSVAPDGPFLISMLLIGILLFMLLLVATASYGVAAATEAHSPAGATAAIVRVVGMSFLALIMIVTTPYWACELGQGSVGLIARRYFIWTMFRAIGVGTNLPFAIARKKQEDA